MIDALSKLYSLLDRTDTQQLVKLFAIVLLMTVLEVVGIASVIPFFQVAADPASASANDFVGSVFNVESIPARELLLWLGIGVVLLLTFSNLTAIFAVWLRHRIAWGLSHQISMRLLNVYAGLPYAFYLTHDSADLIKKIISDVNNLIGGVILAGSQLVCQIMIASAICVLLFLIDPWISMVAFLVFAGTYAGIFIARRAYITDLGRIRLESNYRRFKTFSELVTGIRTIKSYGCEAFFIKRYEEGSQTYSETEPRVQFAAVVPRYLIDILAFGGLIVFTLYLVANDSGLTSVIPKLAMFALAGYRLLPALNAAHTSMTMLLSCYPAVESIYEDLHAAIESGANAEDNSLSFDDQITLNEVCFQYDKGDQMVLEDVSLSIPKGTKIGFVGPTGSGKTTLIEVIMGLLTPVSGRLLVDDVEIDSARHSAWRRMIGYVPQDVFIYDDTIAKNIAFGAAEIDDERIQFACSAAQIDEFVQSELSNGYETIVGERGIRLSGGQRQRLGLARALYRNPSVLLLDEATSALDSVTERRVTDAIHTRFPNMTIIVIAHRISTVRQCDQLYLIDRGQVVGQGTYADLMESSDMFRELATFA